MKKNYRNLFQNIGIFTLTNFVSRFLSLIILPLYTYYLSTEEYGTIDLVTTVISLIFPIFSLTISDAVLRLSISDGEKQKEIFSDGIKVILIGSIPVALGTMVSSFFINDLWILCSFFVIYFLQAFNTIFGAFAKAINKTRLMAIITLIVSISIVAFNVFFVAAVRWGIRGYWISTILGNLIGFILYIFVCKLYNYWKAGSIDRAVLKEMLMYSVPLIPNALFWWINSSLDRWALTLLTSVSVVGLYSCANKIPSALSTVNTIFSQAWNLSLFQSDDSKERHHFFLETYQYYNEVLFCCSIGIIWLSKVVASLIFSKDFYQSWILIPLLTFGVYYSSLNAIIGSLFTAEKKTKYIFTTTFIGSLVNCILNFLLVFVLQAQGAALATLISYILVWLMRVRKIRLLFDIRINYRKSALQFLILCILSILMICEKMFLIVSLVVIVYCLYFAATSARMFIKSIKSKCSKV